MKDVLKNNIFIHLLGKGAIAAENEDLNSYRTYTLKSGSQEGN